MRGNELFCLFRNKYVFYLKKKKNRNTLEAQMSQFSTSTWIQVSFLDVQASSVKCVSELHMHMQRDLYTSGVSCTCI